MGAAIRVLTMVSDPLARSLPAFRFADADSLRSRVDLLARIKSAADFLSSKGRCQFLMSVADDGASNLNLFERWFPTLLRLDEVNLLQQRSEMSAVL